MVLAAREAKRGSQAEEGVSLAGERGREGELGLEGGAWLAAPVLLYRAPSHAGIGWPGLGLRFCVSHEHPRDADVACLFPTLPAASVDITEVLC